jgi:aminoglycoside phosphotransferase
MFLVKADLELPDERLRSLRGASSASLGIDAPVREFGPGGTFHRLYEESDGTLARVAAFEGAPWNGLMAMEAALASFLRARGLPVPECQYEPRGLRGAQRVERVRGETASARDDDEDVTLRRLEAVARFLARLHAIRGRGYGPVVMEADGPRGLFETWGEYIHLRLADHTAACEASGAIDSSERRRVEAHFAQAGSLTTDPALLHGDPGGHNFMLEDDVVVGAIDWEDALLGDPLFDLASLCTFQPERRHPRILAAYGAPLDRRRFWLYFLRVALAKTVHRARFGYSDAPGRAPASQRIQLALSRLEGLVR